MFLGLSKAYFPPSVINFVLTRAASTECESGVGRATLRARDLILHPVSPSEVSMPITPAGSNDAHSLQAPGALRSVSKAFEGSGAVDYRVQILNTDDMQV